MGKKKCKFAGQKSPGSDDFLQVRSTTRICRHPRVRKFFDSFACTGTKPYPLCCPYSGVSLNDEIAVGVVTCQGRQENYFVIDRTEESMIRNAAKLIFDACKTLNRHYRPLGIDVDFKILRRETLLSSVTFVVGDSNGLLDKVLNYELEKYSVIMLSLLNFSNDGEQEMDMTHLLEIDNQVRRAIKK